LNHSELKEEKNNIENSILGQPHEDYKANELAKNIDAKIDEETNKDLDIKNKEKV